MERDIITINEELCNGCGLCVGACHEGALQMIDGKAKLVSESYCDGLGDCLPECPTGAITIERREAADFDKAAVEAHVEKEKQSAPVCACPGSRTQSIRRGEPQAPSQAPRRQSELRQWPVSDQAGCR